MSILYLQFIRLQNIQYTFNLPLDLLNGFRKAIAGSNRVRDLLNLFDAGKKKNCVIGHGRRALSKRSERKNGEDQQRPLQASLCYNLKFAFFSDDEEHALSGKKYKCHWFKLLVDRKRQASSATCIAGLTRDAPLFPTEKGVARSNSEKEISTTSLTPEKKMPY
ncbi:hypothetical protein CEXT_695471 [Caerostris extrusa]|uniref:Uncharacterized protein n=1 Tax=Caerostris extrusa TaxID=172846 RepID=A0AAV4QX29_CAEEX|nr:hypothetical protein CEXT_695471 [Caerostris extrusa]